MLVARPPQVPGAPLLRNLAAIQINAVVENATTVTAIAVEPIKTVVVQPGQTLASLSAAYHVSTSAIQWGNQLTPNVVPKAGLDAADPAGTGSARRGAARRDPDRVRCPVHLDPAVILDYNGLTSDAPMAGGSYLQVPLSRAPDGALIASYFVDAENGVPSVRRRFPVPRRLPIRSVHLLRGDPTRGRLERQRHQLVARRPRQAS